MNLIIMGMQGSGKGTQAKILAEKLRIPHISTGDLVRGTEGELKKKIDSFINIGKLVPDELIIEILKERFSKEDCKNGFILDGFPRNIHQAKELEKISKIDKIIEIELTDEEAIKRIIARFNCSKCKTDYNSIISPPKKEGVCDKCGANIVKRADDNEEAIKKRLSIYHNETEPILEHYKSVKINGNQPVEKVSKDILNALSI